MKIGIASDHRGFSKKEKLIKYLRETGNSVVDYGDDKKNPTDDYPIFAFKLGEDIENVDLGILLCGTGIGICIAANKVNGVRCAKVDTVRDAKLSRLDNNANIISVDSSYSLYKLKRLINAFIKTPFSNEERHIRRVNMIDNYVAKL